MCAVGGLLYGALDRMFGGSPLFLFVFYTIFLHHAQQYVEMREHEMHNETYAENIDINMDISQPELLEAINKLKVNKSCGIDGVPNEVLKHEGIVQLLLSFLNMCFKHSRVPTLWRQAIIKPIPKGATKDPCVPLNYRGISLISCVSKLLLAILNSIQFNSIYSIY